MFTVSFTELFTVLTILVILLVLKNFLNKKNKTPFNEYSSKFSDCTNRCVEHVYVETEDYK